jgi:hypothetical protein
LSQFHPIAENDRWWGTGFTEWTNVTRARPNFDGHYQPHLPADLGFYDLRVPETREQQAALARCAWHPRVLLLLLLVCGKRLLERPVEEMRASGRPEFPYCFCWANENWTRRWDGADREILIAQDPSRADDERLVRDLLPHFRDPRYIRVNGRPLFMVYRVGALPDVRNSAASGATFAAVKEWGSSTSVPRKPTTPGIPHNTDSTPSSSSRRMDCERRRSTRKSMSSTPNSMDRSSITGSSCSTPSDVPICRTACTAP